MKRALSLQILILSSVASGGNSLSVLNACLHREFLTTIVDSTLHGSLLERSSSHRRGMEILPFEDAYRDNVLGNAVNSKLNEALKNSPYSLDKFKTLLNKNTPALPQNILVVVHPATYHSQEISTVMNRYPDSPRFVLVNDQYPLSPAIRSQATMAEFSLSGQIVFNDLRLVASESVDVIGGNCSVCMVRALSAILGQPAMKTGHRIRILAEGSYDPGLIVHEDITKRKKIAADIISGLVNKGAHVANGEPGVDSSLTIRHGDKEIELNFTDWW